jgi:hypothetical protein
MAGASSASVELRDVVIVGGGCYGTFYAGQLVKAQERGKAAYRKLVVVDRDPGCRFSREIGVAPSRALVTLDWSEFFDQYLSQVTPSTSGDPADAIVPSPLMPHLMYQWLVCRARQRWPNRTVETWPVPFGPGTPYDVSAPDGARYVSHADWTCPTHCIEPALCPVIRAPRSWEMSESIGLLTRRLDVREPTRGPVLFRCEHRVYGVGMFDVADVLEGDRIVAAAGAESAPVNVVVATVSSCHGAVNLLHLS